MFPLVTESLLQALKVTALVFGMMVGIDLLNVVAKGRLKLGLQGAPWRQYVLAAFLGATPGCLGAFANTSLYVHGGLTFGALVGGMIATCGDEAFVMLSLFPAQAGLLFGLLFVAGILFGWLTDWLVPRLHVQVSQDCDLQAYHEGVETGPHYLRHHVWDHIVRAHLWRVFLWTWGALLVVDLGLHFGDLTGFVADHMVWVLLLSGVIAVIPESGPHLIFVMLFLDGVVPFSVLFTSSFVQDGHGMLPLLSYTVRDSVLVKAFNLVFGLAVGILLYAVGW